MDQMDEHLSPPRHLNGKYCKCKLLPGDQRVGEMKVWVLILLVPPEGPVNQVHPSSRGHRCCDVAFSVQFLCLCLSPQFPLQGGDGGSSSQVLSPRYWTCTMALCFTETLPTPLLICPFLYPLNYSSLSVPVLSTWNLTIQTSGFESQFCPLLLT